MTPSQQNLTEHQENWWGLQNCRRCNLQSVQERPYQACTDCDGSGWTESAALAQEPWTEVQEGLYVGGHDFNSDPNDPFGWESASPDASFDVVISMYTREDCHPAEGTYHYVAPKVPDAALTEASLEVFWEAAMLASSEWLEGKKVLIRCQAGLNRANLVATLVLLMAGWDAEEAIAMLRRKRSPWVLCNRHFEDYLLSLGSAEGLTGSN